MKLDFETDGSMYVIRGYHGDSVIINEQPYRRSVIVTPARLVEDWPPASANELRIEHISAIIELEPEIVLLGTGSRLSFPAAEITRDIVEAGIGFEVMNTPAACRSYTILAAEQRRVAAALIIG